jgi:hypothetical protein
MLISWRVRAFLCVQWEGRQHHQGERPTCFFSGLHFVRDFFPHCEIRILKPLKLEVTMSDAKKTFAAVLALLRTVLPKELKARQARHLNTLAALICGMIRSESVQLQKISEDRSLSSRKVFALPEQSGEPDQTLLLLDGIRKSESRNLLPAFRQADLECVSICSAGHGNGWNRDWMALVIAVVYKQRALPIAWLRKTNALGMKIFF